MNIEIETCKVIDTIVRWNVGIPRIGFCEKSKSFLVNGNNWNLKLVTSYSEKSNFSTKIGEHWLMTYNSDDKNHAFFHLTTFIRDKGRNLGLCKSVISNKDTVIWRSSHSDFREKYPDIKVVGNLLHFVFHFHLGIPDPETLKKVAKSVQTSDSNTGAKYPENHPCLENLSLEMSKLVEEGTDTDVQLKCGDVSIAAHKLILGARSEVFRIMMQSDMVEGRECIVEIIDMEPKILKIFIRYIYSGILPELTVDTTLLIYEVADKYQVEALKKRSGRLLVKNLSPENALVILAAADAHSDSDLKDQLVSYISEEKIPTRKVEWLKFCNEYPKLANEVLNFMVYQVFPIN